MNVPLAVRFKTALADMHVTRDLRSLSFRKVANGGYASASFRLDRPLSVDAPEIQPYGDVIVYDGRNGNVVWQGRQEEPGRGVGSEGRIWSVDAVGPAAHARDRRRSLIYVDRNIERWHRLASSFEGGQDHPYNTGGANQDPGLMLRFPGGSAPGVATIVGRAYGYLNDSGQKLARYAFTYDMGVNDTTFDLQAVTRAGAAGGGTVEADIDFTTTAASLAHVVVSDFANGQDWLEVRIQRDAGTTQLSDDLRWCLLTSLAVRALLLDKDGTEITTGYTANTVLASEVVKDLLGRWLTEYDGATATVDTTSYAIEQFAFPDGVTAADVLDELVTLEPTFRWGAYEWTDPYAANPKYRFEWKAWPTTVRYEADTYDGFESPAPGDEVFNAVNVRWVDSLGRRRMTRRTQTVTDLDDAGLTREDTIDLGDETATLTDAQRAGDQWLAERDQAPNQGTLTVSRPIADATDGGMAQPWEIQAGTLIRVRDVLPRVDALNATDRDAVTVFRINAVDYDSETNTARLELDARPRRASALTAAARNRQRRR